MIEAKNSLITSSNPMNLLETNPNSETTFTITTETEKEEAL